MPDPGVALITGAAHGIGRAIANRLAADGHGVVILDVDAVRGKTAAGHIGPRAVFVEGDAAAEADVVAAVQAARGLGPLTCVVANAGVMIRKPVAELSLDEWRRVIDTNLTGAYLLARHAGPELSRHAGSMVLIASTRATMSEPDTEAYAASKGGLVALGHALAMSFAHRVRVNTVSPGWIDVSDGHEALSPEDHAQHPAGRVGRPDDVAGLVSWLVSPQAAFVTGANYVIDGGMTRKMIYVE